MIGSISKGHLNCVIHLQLHTIPCPSIYTFGDLVISAAIKSITANTIIIPQSPVYIPLSVSRTSFAPFANLILLCIVVDARQYTVAAQAFLAKWWVFFNNSFSLFLATLRKLQEPWTLAQSTLRVAYIKIPDRISSSVFDRHSFSNSGVDIAS